MMGSDWRPKYDPRAVHRELEIIKNNLHCNAVRICGLDLKRLVDASEYALEEGLEVWFSPEMWDRTQEETLAYIQSAAVEAEKLRERWPGRLVFSLGSELTLFMKGIVEGDNFFKKMNNPAFWENIKAGKHNAPLNDFLSRANSAVRRVFHGEVTYFSVPLETVDWSLLDYVGVDFYRDARISNNYGDLVKGYLSFKKPVLIGEFGCCTYLGAEKLGGTGFMIIFGMMKDYLPDIKLPPVISQMIAAVPQVDGHYVRDEDLQARELSDQLAVLDRTGVDGAFVFTFVAPTSLYSDDPRFDTDMPSYSLVKSYAEPDTVDQINEQGAKTARELTGIGMDPAMLPKFASHVGKHGETYPDMPWEPKRSFRAVADYYSSH